MTGNPRISTGPIRGPVNTQQFATPGPGGSVSAVGVVSAQSRQGVAGRRLSEPRPRAHRLVKQLFLLMELSQVSMAELSRKSGVGYGTMKDWWSGKSIPDLVLLDSALQALGYRIEITEK